MKVQGGEGRRKGKFRCRCVVRKGGEGVCSWALAGLTCTHVAGDVTGLLTRAPAASLGQAIGGTVVLGAKEMLHLGRKA